MIQAEEVLARAQERMPRRVSRGGNSVQALISEEIRLITEALVDDINAELEILRALVRPGSDLEHQIAQREAERAELRKLEDDERRDALTASMEIRT